MRNLRRVGRSIAAMALLLSSVSAHGGEMPIQAVWKPHRATFVYVGHTTFYTCAALEQKLTLVLRVIGAHDEITFDRRECKTHGPTRLHVVFKSPIEASAQNIQALTAHDTEAQLIARLRGQQLPTAQDLASFPASFQQVSFSGDRRLRLSAADCEFVDHVRRQLVPHLEARVVLNRIFCAPGAHSIRPPRFVISTLVADVQ
jgi:hypothetical protein